MVVGLIRRAVKRLKKFALPPVKRVCFLSFFVCNVATSVFAFPSTAYVKEEFRVQKIKYEHHVYLLYLSRQNNFNMVYAFSNLHDDFQQLCSVPIHLNNNLLDTLHIC